MTTKNYNYYLQMIEEVRQLSFCIDNHTWKIQQQVDRVSDMTHQAHQIISLQTVLDQKTCQLADKLGQIKVLLDDHL